MQVIATTANRNRTRVWPKIWKILPGLRPRRRAARIAAKKQPVPVAVSQLKSKRAASAVGFCHTGTLPKTFMCQNGPAPSPGAGVGFPSGHLDLEGAGGGSVLSQFSGGRHPPDKRN